MGGSFLVRAGGGAGIGGGRDGRGGSGGTSRPGGTRPGAPSAQGPAGADGADGADGIDGIDGVDGADGAQGPPGLSNIEMVGSWGAQDSVDFKTHTVWCPSGKKAISGGYNISGGGTNILIRTSHPQWHSVIEGAPDGWQISAHEITPTVAVWRIRAVVLCANVEE